MAGVVLPSILSSHMVLQRDRPVPVWGTAASHEKVTVEFAGQQKATTADAQGHWQVVLDAMPASSEPREMVVTAVASNNQITSQRLADILVGEVWLGAGQSNMAFSCEFFRGRDPVLARQVDAGPYPQLRIHAGQWLESSPRNLAAFSAQLFVFGLELQRDLRVPVGLMVGAAGGTPAGFWLSREAYECDAACRERIAQYARTYDYSAAIQKYERAACAWRQAVAAAQGRGEKKLPPAPVKPLKAGEFYGLGAMKTVGELYEKKIRLPFLPYAIRGVLWDQGESGTAIEGCDAYTLMGALIRGWRRDWGYDFPFIYVQKPSGGGCAWRSDDPVTCQAEKAAPLPAVVPNDGAERETYLRIMTYPAVFMATSSDLGAGIHPVNKSGYGARAARVALGAVYQRPIAYYGPTYQSHTVEGGKLIVRFGHTGQGLACGPGERLRGFALAGADGRYEWADASISGDTVVLSSDKVAHPVSVRYAWASRPSWANLFNRDGLPALPFRTDRQYDAMEQYRLK